MSADQTLGPLPVFPHGYLLETSRLRLSAPELGDAPGLWPCLSNPDLPRFLAWEPHRDQRDTRLMLEALISAQLAGTGFHWVVRCKSDVVGLVSLIDVRRRHRAWVLNRAELAYWVALECQGRGIATEAAAAVLQFACRSLHFHKLKVFHAADNAASGRTIEKLGFRYVGEERDAFQKNGHWHHLRHFEMLADDLPHFTESPRKCL